MPRGPGARVTVGLALTLLMLTSAIGAVSVDLGSRQASAAAAERQERSDLASTTRLTAQAELYVAAQRSGALEAALAAIADADDVVVVASGVIEAEAVLPLDQAVADLRTLVDTAGLRPSGTGVAPADGTARDQLAPPRIEATGVVADIPQTPPPDESLAMLGLSASTRMLELADEVADLTDQVRMLADAAALLRAAAEAAAAEEQAAARVAAEQAANELARKIAAADASPNGAIPHDLLCGVGFDPGVLLRCDAAAALEELDRAFRARFGHDLDVSSSYRDYPTQVAARESKGSLAAEPGTSNHGRGLAVDLDGFGAVGQFDRPYYLWMREKAAGVGWTHPAYMGPGGSGPQEPWHWEYGTD